MGFECNRIREETHEVVKIRPRYDLGRSEAGCSRYHAWSEQEPSVSTTGVPLTLSVTSVFVNAAAAP
jgi:hypothetical protein